MEVTKTLNSCVYDLRSAEVVSDWIGLRPYRVGGVRLELEETRTKSGDTIKVTTIGAHRGTEYPERA